MKNPDEAWAVAYAVAFTATVLGSEIRGGRHSPEEIDQRSRALADRAVQTLGEKLAVVPRGRA